MPFPANTVIGNYELLELLGVGGMGEVYLARHTNLHRMVAFKVLKDTAGDDDAVLRFKREIDIHVQLVHPNLVRLMDGGCQDGVNYLVMELLEGDSLDKRSRGKPMPLGDFLRLAKPMISALQYVHEKVIVHRDLKPSNILMTREGILKVSDFGLAQAADTTLLTQQGQVVGTPAYMPPEVLMGSSWSPAGDMFSVGIMFYELLAESVPFRRDLSLVEYIELVEKVPPPPIGEKRKTGRPELDDAVMALLSPDATRRPSAGEVAATLERVESGRSRPSRPVTARISVITPPPISAPTQRPAWLGGVLAVALLLPLAAVGWKLNRSPAPRHDTPASAVVSAVPSPDVKPSPSQAVLGRLVDQMDAIEDIDKELNKSNRGRIDDAMGTGGRDDRTWNALKKKAYWQVRSLVHTAVEEGVTGPMWLEMEGEVTALFKTLDRQNFYGGLGKDHELDIILSKLDVQSEDPYRRVASIILSTFIRRDARGTDASRQTSYLECVGILEDQAREPGNNLCDHHHLMRLLVVYSDLLGIDIEVRSLLKSAGVINKGIFTARHRVMDIALECLPRVEEWARTERFSLERFCHHAAQEAVEVLEKLVKDDPELGRKALQVVDGYIGLIVRSARTDREAYSGRIKWSVVEGAATQLGYRFAHIQIEDFTGKRGS